MRKYKMEDPEKEVKQVKTTKRKYVRKQKVITARALKFKLKFFEEKLAEANAAVKRASETYGSDSPVTKMEELALHQISGAIGIVQRMIWEIEGE